MSGQDDVAQRPDGWIEISKEPIFEVIAPGGHHYRIWADGKVEGFPEGAFVVNRIAPSFNFLAGLIVKATNDLGAAAKQAARICR